MPTLATPVRPDAERNALALQWKGLVPFVLRRLWHLARVRRHADECRSAAFLTLLRAAALWREGGGAKFSTYAVAAIRGRVLHEAFAGRRFPVLFGDLARDEDNPFDPPAPGPYEPPPDVDHDRLIMALARVRPQYARVLVLRFGLDRRGERTLEEVGRELRVNRSRAMRIEARALDALARQMDWLEEREGVRREHA